MIKISGTSWRWDLRILLAMNRVTILDYLLGIIAAVSALYIVLDYEGIASRAGVPTTRDIIFGLMLVVLLLRPPAGLSAPPRRSSPAYLSCTCLPGRTCLISLPFKGASLSRFISQMTMDTEGIYGVPLHVSATVVFSSCCSGQCSNGPEAAISSSSSPSAGSGRFRGGAAKAAVLGSALTGVVFRFEHRQRGHDRDLYHPAYEEGGLSARKGRGRGSGLVHQQPACPRLSWARRRSSSPNTSTSPTSKSPRRPPSRPSPPMRACSGSPTWKLASSGCAACPNRTAVFLDHAQRGAALPHPHLHVAV